jgi:hypothetical protein
MSPLPGFFASEIQGHLSGPVGAYDSLAVTTLSSTTASITFNGIPSEYKHLQIRAIARTDAGGGTTQNFNMTINNDTGIAYSFHQLLGNGSSASSYGENVNRTNCVQILHITTSAAGANIFGAGIIDILDYTNTNKNRTIRTLRGQEQNNSDSGIALQSYLYTGTAAVNRLDFFAGSGNLVANTSIALYGVK